MSLFSLSSLPSHLESSSSSSSSTIHTIFPFSSLHWLYFFLSLSPIQVNRQTLILKLHIKPSSCLLLHPHPLHLLIDHLAWPPLAARRPNSTALLLALPAASQPPAATSPPQSPPPTSFVRSSPISPSRSPTRPSLLSPISCPPDPAQSDPLTPPSTASCVPRYVKLAQSLAHAPCCTSSRLALPSPRAQLAPIPPLGTRTTLHSIHPSWSSDSSVPFWPFFSLL